MIILKQFLKPDILRSFQIRFLCSGVIPMNGYIIQHEAENVKQDSSSDFTDLCDFYGVTLSLGISNL